MGFGRLGWRGRIARSVGCGWLEDLEVVLTDCDFRHFGDSLPIDLLKCLMVIGTIVVEDSKVQDFWMEGRSGVVGEIKSGAGDHVRINDVSKGRRE